MISERLKFYADTPQEKNKYFCFVLKDIMSLKEALWRFFDKGWNIRSAWYEKIDQDTGEIIENTKLNVTELLGEYVDYKTSNGKVKKTTDYQDLMIRKAIEKTIELKKKNNL